jgi:hypothetical protein
MKKKILLSLLSFLFIAGLVFSYVNFINAQSNNNLEKRNLNIVVKKFSPDGKRYGYIVKEKGGWDQYGNYKEGKYFVVIDGQEGKRYDDINIDLFQFSQDGKRYGYIAQEKGKYFVVIDGQEGKRYDNISSFQFSPDGGRYGYVIRDGGRWKDNFYLGEAKYFVVIDGFEGRKYDYIDSFQFSPDGKWYGYIATEYEYENEYKIKIDKIVINGYEVKSYKGKGSPIITNLIFFSTH